MKHLSGAPLECGLLTLPPNILLVRDKHSSLLQTFVNCEHEKFQKIGPRCQHYETLFFLADEGDKKARTFVPGKPFASKAGAYPGGAHMLGSWPCPQILEQGPML